MIRLIPKRKRLDVDINIYNPNSGFISLDIIDPNEPKIQVYIFQSLKKQRLYHAYKSNQHYLRACLQITTA